MAQYWYIPFPSGITPWNYAVPHYIATRLALCMATECVATSENTRVLQLLVASLSRLVMATMRSTSSVCTLVTPDEML